MGQSRIRGQEVSVLIVRDTTLEAELRDVQNFNLELLLEQKDQGYLGETTNRKDDIYNGVKGDFELNVHSQDIFVFQQAVLDRAKRATPDVKFNVSAILAMPSGETPTVLIPDIKFGGMPMNVGSRGDYVKFKVDFTADDYEVQLS